MSYLYTNTYSIVAVDPIQGCLGSAAASCALAVGAMVPHIRKGVGVVNTQHYSNPRMARNILEKMRAGTVPKDAIQEVLRDDSDAENRQFAAIGLSGKKAAWTGSKCTTPNKHKEGVHCVAAGNRLVDTSVIDAMVSTFETTEGHTFADRLLLALEAGRQQGGDALGHESAVLDVVPSSIRETWPLNLIDLRVDHHKNPVLELRRLYGLFVTRNKEYSELS